MCELNEREFIHTLYTFVNWKEERQGLQALSRTWIRVGGMMVLSGWAEMGVFQ